MFFSRVRPDHPRCHSATWICLCVHTRDTVIYSKFHRNPFRGFGAPGGQNLAFPITLMAFTTACTTVQAVEPWYNTVTYYYIGLTTYRCIIWLRHILTSSCQQQRSASPRFQFCTVGTRPTWSIGGAPVGRHLAGFGSVNCKPVNRYFFRVFF